MPTLKQRYRTSVVSTNIRGAPTLSVDQAFRNAGAVPMSQGIVRKSMRDAELQVGANNPMLGAKFLSGFCPQLRWLRSPVGRKFYARSTSAGFWSAIAFLYYLDIFGVLGFAIASVVISLVWVVASVMVREILTCSMVVGEWHDGLYDSATQKYVCLNAQLKPIAVQYAHSKFVKQAKALDRELQKVPSISYRFVVRSYTIDPLAGVEITENGKTKLYFTLGWNDEGVYYPAK